MAVLVEACVDAIDAALHAEKGGAGRIELCGELLQGGVTPSTGLIEAVWERVEIPLFILIRPRAGDFLYSDDEVDVMLRDIEQAHALDVDGVVIGALTRDGDVDVRVASMLIEAAGSLQVTFHRAFDFVRDRSLALETLVELGVDRILTSGGAASAIAGVDELARLRQQAANRVVILAGGSITAANVAEVVQRAGVAEVHVRGAEYVRSGMVHRKDDVSLSRTQPAGEYDRHVTTITGVAAIVNASAAVS